MARRKAAPDTPEEAVAAIEADPRVLWLPIRHFSPACAWHVREWIREERPAAVLVEGPEDATPLIEHVVDPDTRPPITVMSTWVDKRNAAGGNGVLTPDETVAARYRGWWPLVRWAPEYQALVAGSDVGADLRFIDVSLKASVPWQFVARGRKVASVSDRHELEETFYRGLATATRTRSFDAFWRAKFELGAIGGDRERWRRAVLTFAWCARNLSPDTASLEADGTLPRERHMRNHVEQALKDHPTGRIAVVTGAFHTVALPWVKKRKAAKADASTTTLVTAHSWRALSALYDQVRLPAWAGSVWEAIEDDDPRPYSTAARRLVVEVARAARQSELPVSTAEAVAAHTAAINLGRLRGLAEPGLEEVLDAMQSTFVKGDLETHGPAIAQVSQAVMIGHRMGRVAEAAGRPPLLRTFYVEARKHRLELSGEPKVVRVDPAKQIKHKAKSAFLHRCDYLDVPLFNDLEGRRFASDSTRSYYRGADLQTGADMHLVAETWGVRWRESVDDRLVELSDRGGTLEAVAASLVAEHLAESRDDAAAAVGQLLRCVQMRLTTQIDEALRVAEAAFATDRNLDHLVKALSDLVVVHTYRDALDSQGDRRVALAILDVYQRCCLRLPAVRNVPDDQAEAALDRIQTLVRIAATFDAVELDRGLLIERVHEMVGDTRGQPILRGAGYGILYGFGAVRETALSRELEGYLLGSPLHVRQGAAFLDGLFATARSIVLGRDARLLTVISRALGKLEWHSFKLLLPDLRRAFTRFIPAEIDAIAERVANQLDGEGEQAPGDVPEAVRRLVAEVDRRASSTVAGP